MTTPIKNFKDLNVKAKITTYIGDSISLDRLVNIEITVKAAKVVPSIKHEGDCIHVQLVYKEEHRVLFTRAVALMDVIRQLPPDAYPFSTKIVKSDQRYEFT